MKRSRWLPIVVLVALLVSVYFQFFRREVYLLGGWTEYVILSPRLLGPTRVVGGQRYSPINDKIDARQTSRGLQLCFYSIYPENGKYIVDLEPSKKVRGDYNAVRWWVDIDPHFILPGFGAQYDPPLPWLHRVRDKRVQQYIDGCYALASGGKETTDSLLQLARQLNSAYPADLYMRALYMDAVTRNGDYKELADVVGSSEQTFENSNDENVAMALVRARAALRWHNLETSGTNGGKLLAQLTSPQNDLEARRKLLTEIMNYEVAASEPYPLGKPVSLPYFLEHQVNAKVFRQWAMLHLLQGKREEALQELASTYHVGQLLNTDPMPIARLIGIALRAIASGGLKDYALNACETAEEYDRLWATLDRLHALDDDQKRGKPVSVRSPFVQNLGDDEVRQSVSDSSLQLVRMATAAKRHQLDAGKLPLSASDFAPYLSSPPADPFSSQPLRLATDEPYRCYSYGPDKQDDRGLLQYDPTNGTVSPGDLITTISEARVYPFPSTPVHANTRDEILHLFPNGLPVDSFADVKGHGMRITSSTHVCVYSVGPNTDEGRIAPIEDTYVPAVQYDPTNGTISGGDIFITLPEH